MALNSICRCLLWFLFIWDQSSQTKGETLVRLIDGPSRYVGNIEYSKDDGTTWHTTCGEHLTLNVVKVICRQLGFKGANKPITNSPYGNGQTSATSYVTCNGTEDTLTVCSIYDSCSSTSVLGAAACYDERYIGCFRDNVTHRVLPISQDLTDLTIGKCIERCIGLNGHGYAGVEYSSECYCGGASAVYNRWGTLGVEGCQNTCAGDIYSSCGGIGGIAVFDLRVILPSETTTKKLFPTTSGPTKPLIYTTQGESSTNSSDIPSTHPFSITTIAEVESISTFTTRPTKEETNKIALYAGAGSGGAILVILIIIIIIVFVTCRNRHLRNAIKQSHGFDQPLTTMGADNQASSPRVDNEIGPCYENAGAVIERHYQNMNEVDTREHVNLPEVMDNKEQTNMNSEKRAAMEESTHDPAVLYAMPDMSAKTSSRPKTYTSPPNDTDDPSLMYAMPDRRAKTVYSSNSKAALGEDSLDALYATSTKNRLEPIGMEASTEGEGLYALPDENPRDHVTQNGAGKRDDVEAMYAMPDKSRRGNDVDNTVMIENDIYSST